MKPRTSKRMAELVDRSATRTRPNYLYSIISVTLVLFLLGFCGIVILQSQRLITFFKEKVNLLVELKEGTAREEVTELRGVLSGSPFVKEGSVKFVSREEAAEAMRKDFGEDFLKLDLPNPFFDMVTFNVRAAYMKPDSLERIRRQLRERPYVNDVYYQESLVDEIADNVRRIGYIALGIGLFFILVAVALIHNTIRLALYANRFTIKNMELVGASWEFISKPYLIRAFLHGTLSSLLSVILLLLMLYLAQRDLPELQILRDIPGMLILCAGLIILGMLITTLSTYYVVNKYLKMRVDDLY